MHTPTHLYFLICLPQTGNKGTTMNTQNRGSKTRHSHTCMHTLETGNHSCPHSNPEGTTHTTVPPACDLHLGKGIFLSSRRDCLWAGLHTHAHRHTGPHSPSSISSSLFPPATPFHSVDIRTTPTYTRAQTQSKNGLLSTDKCRCMFIREYLLFKLISFSF